MNKIKKYDTVKITRKIRNKLSKKYYNHSEQLFRDMEIINKKYIIKDKSESYSVNKRGKNET